MLEREPVVMPTYHWDIADPLQCVEVIYGTGDMFRTVPPPDPAIWKTSGKPEVGRLKRPGLRRPPGTVLSVVLRNHGCRHLVIGEM